ncbi:sugar phosphate isomerase/epimerase family protein [Swaminathania salitolerans]|uniref:Xylose isomerase n=1 Tax=Swaminathania salitolerans TaxID=182838 RepID=A0A511BMY9_9PROT|nr:sugar phosphate isomerase/epimerase family protein [Swaminathania salitolerans]GEL01024.1 xylose isomerase [Swaminathania salitolerans]
MLRDFGSLNRDTWPIAAAMIQYQNCLPDGRSVQDQSAEEWEATLGEIVEAGFDAVDPTDCWLRVGDLSPARLEAFRKVLARLGLTVPGVSTARKCLVEPSTVVEMTAYCHRVIDAAAALGARTACLGLFGALTEPQKHALWFWTAPGYRNPDDPAIRQATIARLRELGRHAAEVGVDIALEMYEDTYIGTARDAVRFVEEVDHPSVGLNPDLGNLIRLHRPIEPWQEMVALTAPWTRYWHVKNYFREEDATGSAISTIPAPLPMGLINYRVAVRAAIDAGFRGGFCCEHYGGDGLTVSAANRDYLRTILPKSFV